MTARTDVARMIDHTLLKPQSTAEDVAALVAEAQELGVLAVCVSPNMLPLMNTGDLVVATVCGFPSGAHHGEVKAAEAALSVRQGAAEVDMVINLGLALAGDFKGVEAEIREVVSACAESSRATGSEAIVKVIIESAALNDDQIVAACKAAEAAGAHFVKTSTGFHPAGGASAHAVKLMRESVGDRLGVKASGGIRDAEAAQQMIDAGASRLGLSGSAAVLDGFEN
ncbi:MULTISPECIES: deoxyribose-phosphate aldolase [Brevibacterium]|uniref:deoxyribose-phosphate aldolase n=1 Tax=Brevibacterium TaxID=1696 RepID=UPI0021B06406|nr:MULTISPECIES: deoxyribose-phosphate aldolase [Brevibacterium]MCT1830719.1 deoxyribose-phosphate aldolase [Brevibacterium luteolum]MCT1872503.1 deoxyribose-phosphate aldolase [Brevibacterium luteolum]MCT1890440.1 deoxyribose-phosphate aldolase [Brevibacterium luteolum]MCT1892930.1 deoxyribose-phosphate aldolase [Brevibacterium luteolum]MCT1925128.1 deoxyribose-phosphate aldolase [Brevibacterium luteolum]